MQHNLLDNFCCDVRRRSSNNRCNLVFCTKRREKKYAETQKAGKCNIPIHKQKYAIRRAIIETESLLPGNVLKVFADENYIGRITLFGFPNSNSAYYTVEEYASDYNLDKVYESEIYEDVEQISTGLEALIDITEKVVRV